MPDEALLEPSTDQAQAGSHVDLPPASDTATTDQQSKPSDAKGKAAPESLSSILRAKIKEKAPPEPPKEKKEPETTPKVETEKPKTTKRVKKESESSIDPARLAEIQGREIGAQIAEGLRSKPEAQPEHKPSDADIVKQLPAEYQEDSELYLEMQSLFPKKHGDIITKLKDATAKEAVYSEAWEKEHPGETFNPDTSEHDAWYKKNFPDIPDKDIEAARSSLLAKSIEAKLDSKYRAEIEALKNERTGEKLAPVISEQVHGMVENVLAAIDPQLKDAASSLDKLKQLPETNPLAAEVLQDIHQKYSPLLTANLSIHRGTEAFNDNIQLHHELYKLAKIIEQKTAAAPIDQRVDSEGRVFATRTQYSRMSEEQQAKHWFVDEGVLAYVITQKAAAEAKSNYVEKQSLFEKWAKSKGITLPSASPATQNPDQGKPQAAPKDPKPAEEQHQSPPVPGSGQVPSPWPSNGEQTQNGPNMFLKFLRGR